LIEIKFEQSIVINLSAAETFAYVGNLDNMIHWSNIILKIEKISPELLGVGAIVKITFQFLNQELDITFEVVEHYPDRCLTIKSTSGISPCLFCYRFEPAKGGGTLVSREALIQVIMGGTENLTEREVSDIVYRQLERDLQMLKDVLEARSSICGIVS
jgi:hypothetical protein